MILQNFKNFITYLVILSIPFYIFRFSVFGIKTNFFEIFVIISFLFTCSILFSNKKKIVWTSILPYLFVFIALISTILSNNRIHALGMAKGWFIIPVMLYWIVLNNFKTKDLPKLSGILFIPLIIVSFLALLQKIGVVSTLFYQTGDFSFGQYLTEGRVFGIFESPNYLAMFLVPMIFLTLPYIEIIKTKTTRILLITSYLLPAATVYYSGSRAGSIALIIAFFIYINYRFINLQKARNRQPFYSGFFVFMLGAINAVYLFFVTELIKSPGNELMRIEIYKYSAGLLKNNFLSGIGLGNFQDKIGQISVNNPSFQQYGLPFALHPHNLLLAIWLNLGLAGLIVFLWLIISFFKNTFSSDSQIRAGVIAAMAAILIHGIFDTAYFKNDLSAIFWLIFAFSVIIKNKNEKTADNR